MRCEVSHRDDPAPRLPIVLLEYVCGDSIDPFPDSNEAHLYRPLAADVAYESVQRSEEELSNGVAQAAHARDGVACFFLSVRHRGTDSRNTRSRNSPRRVSAAITSTETPRRSVSSTRRPTSS